MAPLVGQARVPTARSLAPSLTEEQDGADDKRHEWSGVNKLALGLLLHCLYAESWITLKYKMCVFTCITEG